MVISQNARSSHLNGPREATANRETLKSDYATHPHALPENYFRYRPEEWTPSILSIPDAPARMAAGALAGGLPLRDQIIIRLLFESGARVSEVCSLTLHDWWRTKFMNGAASIDKGSHGRRRKTLRWSANTTKLLRRYYSGARMTTTATTLPFSYLESCFRKGQGPDIADEPIFLSRRRRAILPDSFRRLAWNIAASHSSLDITPHYARHWFVTAAMDRIETASRTPEEFARTRRSLAHYVGWRTKERMIQAYDTRPDGPLLLRHIDAIHESIALSEISSSIPSLAQPEERLTESTEYQWLVGDPHGNQS